MNRRFLFLLPLVVVAVVVAVAVGATLVATDGPEALRVGTATVSQPELRRELDDLAHQTDFASGLTGANVSTTAGSIDLGTARAWEQFRILQLLAEHRLHRQGDRVRPADVAAVDGFLGTDFVTALDKMPAADLRATFRDMVAAWLAVARTKAIDLSTDFNTLARVLGRESRLPSARVEVDPRFGVWDSARATVLPPVATDTTPLQTARAQAAAGASG